MKGLHGIGMKWTNMDPTTISSGYQYDKEKEYNEMRARRQSACRTATKSTSIKMIYNVLGKTVGYTLIFLFLDNKEDHNNENNSEIIEIGKNRIGVIGFVDGGDIYKDEDKANGNIKKNTTTKKTIWEKLKRKQNNNKKDSKKN